MRYDDLIHDIGILMLIVVPILILLIIMNIFYERSRSKEFSLTRNYNQNPFLWILLISAGCGFASMQGLEKGLYAMTGIFSFLVSVLLVLVGIYYTRIYLDEDGITIVRFCRKRRLKWSEIDSSFSGGVKGCNIYICLKNGGEICFTSVGVSLGVTKAIALQLERMNQGKNPN